MTAIALTAAAATVLIGSLLAIALTVAGATTQDPVFLTAGVACALAAYGSWRVLARAEPR